LEYQLLQKRESEEHHYLSSNYLLCVYIHNLPVLESTEREV